MSENTRSVPRVRSYRRGQLIERRRPKKVGTEIIHPVGTTATVIARSQPDKAFYTVRLEDGSVEEWFAPQFRAATPQFASAAS